LIAIAVGALEKAKIGPRSFVYSEKEMLEKAVFEFSETEDFIQAAESFLILYQFKNYDLLLMPPSFPYGGMENTFELFSKFIQLDVLTFN
jgi:leukotriene-A4 hydrolase